MAKKSEPIRLRLNLLRPQGVPDKIAIKFIRWLLSAGRFIIVLVEALVLIAFLSRFKYDSDLETLKENIDAQIPYITSLKSDEILIRQTQNKLSIIKDKRLNYPDYEQILNKIALQTPLNLKITSINIDKNDDKTEIKISGTSITNNEITSLVSNLKSEKFFNNVNLSGVSLENGAITFNLSLTAPSVIQKEKGV